MKYRRGIGGRFILNENLPEAGRLVRARERLWIVDDVSHQDVLSGNNPSTLVTLESIEDSDLGNKTTVVLEREVDFQVLPESALPSIGNSLDTPVVFDSFVNALRWTNKSILGGDLIRAPFYGAIQQQSFQLEPVVKALSMPRINLLIADDVGLGKTIETGMIIQELILRGKARRILLVCPASLQLQWQWEMEHKFGLDFKILDSNQITKFKREYGINVNPWLACPRIITSMDFIKMEGRKADFLRSCEVTSSKYIRTWDLLVVDEAHNAMPQPTKQYYRDSDRTKMLNEIGHHFEHKIFLTATPHNGRKESFVAFLDMLDPLNFNRGEDPQVNKDSFKKRLDRIMVRRLKRGPNGVKDALGKPLFPERKIIPMDITASPDEEDSLKLLNEYIAQRVGYSSNNGKNRPLEFAMTILKKRLLSSPRAFYNSIVVHTENLSTKEDSEKYLQLVLRRLDDDWDNDLEREQVERELLSSTSADGGKNYLSDLITLASRLKDNPDSKVKALISWIDNNLKENGRWNRERVVIFTEFKDTMDYLTDQLKAHGIEEDRILQLYGGMEMGHRETIKAMFEADPDESPARILVATDAASEGINLQQHCRYMFHMEIPWNPIRLEQRNGRIDRHGQSRDVTIYHPVYSNDADSRFLQVIVQKVEQIREDLSTVNPVIAEKIQRRMLHLETLDESIIDSYKDDLTRDLMEIKSEAAALGEKIALTREKLNLNPEAVKNLLDSALKLNNCPGVRQVAAGRYVVDKLPTSWKELQKYTSRDGRPVTFSFEAVKDSKTRHLHPNHPVIKKAITFFRSNIWSRGLDLPNQRLNKVTCKVVPVGLLTEPLVLLYVRALAVNNLSQPLVEEVDVIGGRFTQGKYLPSDSEYLLSISSKAFYKERAAGLLTELSRVLKVNEQTLLKHLDEFKGKWKATLQKQLKEAISDEKKTLLDMIKERTKEIEKTIARLNKYQGMMFEDQFQLSEDIRLLTNRQSYLKSQLEEIPQKIDDKYTLKGTPLVNVVALCFLVPEEMVV